MPAYSDQHGEHTPDRWELPSDHAFYPGDSTADETDVFTIPTPEAPSTPWRAIGWLVFTILLVCTPAVVLAVYGAVL